MSPRASLVTAPAPSDSGPGEYRDLALAAIVPSETNPRSHFHDGYLEELAASIREKGVIQPILVRLRPGGDPDKAGADYELVAGECRWRASTLAGQRFIPAIVRQYSDEQVLELQLIENLHRRDLTPLEQARGYRALIDTNPTKHSAESIAQRLGMSPQWVWDRMKLNDLVPEAKKILEAERMTVGHAILIARLKPADQARVIDPGSDELADRDMGGLWTGEAARLDELDEQDGKRTDPYDGRKARSIRELEAWINDHVRFDVAHAAKAQPLEFETVAAKVEQAAAQPGRGKKVIAITFDHFTQPEARSEDERTYGPKSFKLADGWSRRVPGSKKSQYSDGSGRYVDAPTCEHAILGVVVAGDRRGQTLDVCIARDTCDVHWKKERAEREKSAKQRASGKGQQSAAREAARERQDEHRRELREQRWKVFSSELKRRVTEALDKLPQTLPKRLYAKVLAHQRLPAATKPAELGRALLRSAVANEFRNPWSYNEEQLVAWAKALGVDVKACEPASVQTPGVKKGARK